MSTFRIGYAGAAGGHEVRSGHEQEERGLGLELVARQSTPTACNLAKGDLYTFPNSTSTIDGTVPLTFKWNTRCPGIATTIDLYLYAPDTLGLIKQFPGIPFSNGEFSIQLQPRWWNSTTEARLQMAIMNSGGMSWATTGPPGPVFGVTYPESAMLTTTTEGGMVRTLTNSAAATNGGDAIFQNVSNTQRPSISKGAIAAAVVVPIIVIAAIVAVAVRFWRQREAEKRRRWSQALSSTSNLDWEKGARAGERTGSMFGPGRPSMSSYGHPRASMAASSVFGENMAGAGAAGAGAAGTMRQTYMRNVSNDALNPNPRQSRISFAESARPERGDRRSRMSLGNDLRPHSAVFNLKPGSRSASDLPASNLGPGAQGSPSPSKSSRLRGLQGSAIADDDEGSVIGKGGRRGSAGSDARRSAYSAYSTVPTPAVPTLDADRTEDLDVDYSSDDGKTALPTATSTSTVAYGPDSLLAAYAARQAAGGATSPVAESPMPMPIPMTMAPPAVPASNSKKGLKILTAFGKKSADDSGGKNSPASAQGQGQSLAGGLQVPPVAMTRQGGGMGRGASPSPGPPSPGPHAL